jgi:tetratricopeptide (TPR) repeat protein
VSRNAAIVVVALAVVLAGCASTETDKQVQRLQARSAYEQALKNLQDRRVSLGMAALQQAITLDPENALYRNTLGVVLLDLKQPAQAQDQVERAIALDPDYAEAHHNLGLAHAEQGRFGPAVAAYRKALTYPTYTTPEVAYNNLGNAYFALGQLKEAEESYRAALRLEGRLPSAYYGLGMVLNRQGRGDEARASLRAAREIDPDSVFGRAASEALKVLGEGGPAPGSPGK